MGRHCHGVTETSQGRTQIVDRNEEHIFPVPSGHGSGAREKVFRIGQVQLRLGRIDTVETCIDLRLEPKNILRVAHWIIRLVAPVLQFPLQSGEHFRVIFILR